jgi:hypothetical protein
VPRGALRPAPEFTKPLVMGDACGGAMRALNDSGYLECSFTGSGIALIRLDHEGRKQVEGWPSAPGPLSASDVEELVGALEERSKARAAATAIRNLGRIMEAPARVSSRPL